jgi:opacity protein-like surface antigen
MPFRTEKIHPYVSSGISLSKISNKGSIFLAKPYVASDELYIGDNADLKYIKYEGDEMLVSLIVGSGFEYSINDNSALDLRIGYMFSLGSSFEKFDEMTDDVEIKKLRSYFEGYDLSGFTFRCGLKSYF